jgi:hypothetical protein
MDVSDERYEELVNRLLDGELSSAEAGELAETVRARPELQRDLRRHLQLWELWSQEHAVERSAGAFFAAFRTRQRAEGEGESFLTKLKARLPVGREDTAPSAGIRAPGRWRDLLVHPFRHPVALAWAASLTVVATLALLWLLAPRTAEARTMHGEAICTKCMLHETHDHLPAIRVREGDTTRVYRLRYDPPVTVRIGNYCAAPIPVVVTGTAASRDGLLVLDASSVAVEPPDSPPSAKPGERTLFPF